MTYIPAGRILCIFLQVFPLAVGYRAAMTVAEVDHLQALVDPEGFTKKFDIDGLAESALKSFSIIEPWRQAQKTSV